MRTEVWYPLVGLAVLAWLTLGLQTALNLTFLKGGVVWANWIFGVVAGLLSLAAGSYAAKNTWIEDVLKWFLGLHPAVTLAIGIGFIVLVWKLALGLVPDKWAGSTLTVGSMIVAFWLPMIVDNALPPGDVGDLLGKAVDTVQNFAVDKTDGWFK